MMKIAASNTNPVNAEPKRPHTCNVCGSMQFWTDAHWHIERLVNPGRDGYEAHFITCSDECRKRAKDFYIEWLGSQPEWTKKSAKENWENYIQHEKEN